MGLKEEMKKLIELQQIDSELSLLIHQKDVEKPKFLEELDSDFEEKRKNFLKTEEEINKIQVRRKEKELDLETKEENLRKFQAQLYQLKTNQEYQAKLKEIESQKADISVIEEEIISILDELEAKEKEHIKNKKILEAEERELKKKKEEINSEIKRLQEKISILQDKRNILKKNIDPQMLSRYEYILKNRDGLALVPLKEGSCGGCFMNLPPDVINRIKRYEEIVSCEMCARLLYLEEDFL